MCSEQREVLRKSEADSRQFFPPQPGDEDHDDGEEDDYGDHDDNSVDACILLATSGSMRIPSSLKTSGSSLIAWICSRLPWKYNFETITSQPSSESPGYHIM